MGSFFDAKEEMTMFDKITFTHDYWIFVLPLVFMAVDILTGYLHAWLDRDIQSAKMRSGVVKKAGEMVAIMACYILSKALTIPVDITKFFSVLITFTELNSNIENLALLGVPVPDWMRRRINQTIDEMNAGDEKEEGE